GVSDKRTKAEPKKAIQRAGGGSPPPRTEPLPFLKPPYGRITAYDMNKGDIAWQVPNGDTPQNIKDILTRLGITNVPPTGSQSQAGVLVTKTLLVCGEGAGGHPLLHADDKKNGEKITEVAMPGTQTGIPMTYTYHNP